jgi:hypothetical protein
MITEVGVLSNMLRFWIGGFSILDALQVMDLELFLGILRLYSMYWLGDNFGLIERGYDLNSTVKCNLLPYVSLYEEHQTFDTVSLQFSLPFFDSVL